MQKRIFLKNTVKFLLIYLLVFNNFKLNAQYTLDRIGLTSTTPAAAAYALRQLSTNYTGPLVRVVFSTGGNGRSVCDVYPDENGVLSNNSPVSTGTIYLASFGTTPIQPPTTKKAYEVGSMNQVLIWYDQSGNNRNLVGEASGFRPSLEIKNGRFVIRFFFQADEVRDIDNTIAYYNYYGSPLATAPGTFFPNAVTMVASAKGNSADPSILISKCGNGGDNTNRPSPFDFNNEQGQLLTGNAYDYQSVNLSTTTPVASMTNSYGNTMPTLSFTSKSFDYTNVYVGKTKVASGWTSHYQDFGNKMTMGKRNDGTISKSFNVAEVVMFNAVLPQADLFKVIDEQNAFTNATYFTAQPATTAQNYCIGSTATPLTVAINNPALNASIEWYRTEKSYFSRLNNVDYQTNGLPTGGVLVGTGTTYTPNTSIPGAYFYYAKIKTAPSNFALYSKVSGLVTVKANAPNVTINKPNGICLGENYTFSANLPSGGNLLSSTGKYRVHTYPSYVCFY
jgi:hypothetical protein